MGAPWHPYKGRFAEQGVIVRSSNYTLYGDTIDGVGYRPGIRLWSLNAPELRDQAKAETVPGLRACAWVADRLADADHKVRCDPIE